MGGSRNSLETSADDQPFHLPAPHLPFNSPSQRTLAARTRLHLHYSLFTSPNPELQASAHAKYNQSCWGRGRRECNCFQRNTLLKMSTKQVKVELAVIRVKCCPRQQRGGADPSRFPYLGRSWVTGRSCCSCCRLQLPTLPPCNRRCLCRTLREVICALQVWKSKGNTRSKTPPGL